MSIYYAVYLIAVVLIIVTAFYCLMITRNLIRILIALEILIKAVTLLLIAVGHIGGNLPYTESFVITLIIVEVVIMAVAAGIVIGIHKRTGSLNVNNLIDKEETSDE
jgi:NADH:ubiquinone oxidoreductase subunit K